MNMKIDIPSKENYFYELLKKKYHTSEIIRTQIADIKERIKNDVLKEPIKSFTVKFWGQVLNNSFEKTLRIISKRLFSRGRIDYLYSFREQDLVEANITSTLTEIEALIRYLMKPHIVLRCRQGIIKGASNLLIIDEEEKNNLGNFTPDYTHRNYVASADVYEKYTGRLGDYLVLNGVPLTSEKIGRELRFNTIETKNRVFTTTGLKEIYVNLYFLLLILKLDLEQHYLKLRTFNVLENDLKIVEEKIDELSFFSDIFNHITSKDNPLLFHEGLFLDLIKLEHIIENNNWKGIPAYAGYIYSAANKLNNHFKFLEEYGLFVTYAQCIEKFIAKLTKKLFKHRSDFHGELRNLTANYNELKKLLAVSNHPLLQNDYQELLNSFSKLLAYLDFLTIQNTDNNNSGNVPDVIHIAGKSSKRIGTLIKKGIESIFSVTIEVSTKPVFRRDQTLKTDHEKDVQKLILKFCEDLEKLSKLKTTTGEDAFLAARKCIPKLTNLSTILDQLKKLIRDIENKSDVQDPFKTIFVRSNKFEILYKELYDLGVLETAQEQKSVYDILTDLQKLLFNKPLKENAYPEIIKKIQYLEDFIISKNRLTPGKDNSTYITISKLSQNPIFKIIIDIKIGIQNVMRKEAQIQEIDSFKNEGEFLSYSAKELDEFLARCIHFHEKLKGTCYYKNTLKFETAEKDFDCLINEAKDIDACILSFVRKDNKKVSREPDIHINYLKNSQLIRYNLEKAILRLQNQITQMYGFMQGIENSLNRHSFIHSGVATSVLFDQITYLLSNIDVRLIDMTESLEHMFNESVDTIFHYQIGEVFKEPKKEDFDDVMKEIEKRTTIRKYQNHEQALPV
ncbi:MAG: hypothetical protein E3K32_05330 [wastewater metagenome]|nr:hypothetical protein [Candidatus Loosdrechtia aerotolerans]